MSKSLSVSIPLEKQPDVLPLTAVRTISSSRSSSSTGGSSSSTTIKPRMLIGIIGNANNHMGKIYRWRHRQLFELWNDTRLCTLHDFQKVPLMMEECEIVYTFVVGAHNASSGVPPYLLDDSRPLVLDSIPLMPRYKDVNNTDVTILNIQENMNEGKTPTFFYWASQTAKQFNIQYVVKCDSDALLRLSALLMFLHRELPWNPSTATTETTDTYSSQKRTQPQIQPIRSTLMGSFRHKALWNKSADETFWRIEYHHGMHLYLAGQLYLMSVDVADILVQEASRRIQNQNRTSSSYCYYCEGHEDHDATSMIQVATPQTAIRWLSMPKHYRFWEHPVKGDYWWKRIWKREVKKRDMGKRAPNYHIPKAPAASAANGRKSLVLIFGATTEERRTQYRRVLNANAQRQNKIVCSLVLQPTTESGCDAFYVFVVGGNNTDGPTEVLEDAESLRLPQTPLLWTDAWILNLRDNFHSGMVTSALYYMEQRLTNYESRFDLVVLIQADFMIDVGKWLQVQASQSSPHALMIGDVRDKFQEPREFPHGNESHWFLQHENIHLYLGSECLALSTGLIPGIVEQARNNPEPRKNFEGNLGHDLTTLAYYIPKTILHWVPINKSLRFWERIEGFRKYE